MKNLKLFSVFLTVMLMAAFWAPAMTTPGQAAGLQMTATASAPISLTITNPLPKATTVTLTGPKPYTINIPKGATITRTIDPGKYKYNYLGCLNKAKKGNLKTKGATASLKIIPCKMATWTFFNADDSAPFTMTLKGWVSYSVTVRPGQIQTFSWVADRYQTTVRVCGKTHNFTMKVSGKKGWTIKPCN